MGSHGLSNQMLASRNWMITFSFELSYFSDLTITRSPYLVGCEKSHKLYLYNLINLYYTPAKLLNYKIKYIDPQTKNCLKFQIQVYLNLRFLVDIKNGYYRVKSVQIRSFFCFFWSEYREIRIRKNSVFGHFSRSVLSETYGHKRSGRFAESPLLLKNRNREITF